MNNEAAMAIGGDSNQQSVGNGAAAATITTVGRHSAGNICGLTINEYVALPARARISLQFDSDHLGEGFF